MIRMDQANLASAAVPPKMGFSFSGEEDRETAAKGHTGRGFIWMLNLPNRSVQTDLWGVS